MHFSSSLVYQDNRWLSLIKKPCCEQSIFVIGENYRNSFLTLGSDITMTFYQFSATFEKRPMPPKNWFLLAWNLHFNLWAKQERWAIRTVPLCVHVNKLESALCASCCCCLFYFSSSSNEICHSQPTSDAYCKFTYFSFVTVCDRFWIPVFVFALRFTSVLSIRCIRIDEVSLVHFSVSWHMGKAFICRSNTVFFPFPRRTQNGRRRCWNSFHLHLKWTRVGHDADQHKSMS